MFRGFTQKKIHSYTLGEQLKNLRAEGRVTLFEVSRETKIPVKYIEMIEEGKYDKLPPDVYVRGFLRAYAEFLGVDEKKIINLYQREKDIKTNLNGGEKKPPKKKTKMSRFVITPRIFIAASITVVVIGGFSYLYGQIGRFAAVPRLVITNPGGDENIAGNSISISGFTDEDARLTINDQPILVSDKGEFKEDVLLQSGVNVITVSAVNRFNKAVSKTVNIKSDYQLPELAEGNADEGKVIGEQDVKKAGVSVAVRIDSNPTWLSVEADGNLVYSGTMLAGATQNFNGEKEVRISSGKANQTFIRVNGKDEKKLAADPGIVRDVVFAPGD
ncbi:MAG TPA: RodZ domain-containing protein [Candidatus Bathyarchaeia archaeon]|nr:RodZ domain-containing protein [Candidatus Bathyarchaeia archaeon]